MKTCSDSGIEFIYKSPPPLFKITGCITESNYFIIIKSRNTFKNTLTHIFTPPHTNRRVPNIKRHRDRHVIEIGDPHPSQPHQVI